jgi:YggT family protein
MNGVLVGLALLSRVIRLIVLTVVAAAALACILDWLVRTRRINPFNPIARFLRQTVEPLLRPLERRIVRAGGLPSSAPLWALAISIVGGIVLISLADFLIAQVAQIGFALSGNPRSLYALLVHWTILILQIGLIVRVIVSWLPISPYSRWVHWSFTISEPILRPLRQFVPSLGMFDITPIVAYFLLEILEWALLSFHL